MENESLSMAEIDPSLDDGALRAEFHAQTARIPWLELQTLYARGLVVEVAETIDLVEVALQLTRDNTSQFENWIAESLVMRVDDDRALLLYETEAVVWAVVAAPWVLVQLTSLS